MRRHDFDGLSFAFGLLFAVVGVLLIGGVTLRESLFVAWAGPAFLIALAVIIVLAARPRSSGVGDDAAESGDAAESAAG